MNPSAKAIAVSKLIDPSWIIRLIRLGADAILTKPVAAEQCLATLRFTLFQGNCAKYQPEPRKECNAFAGTPGSPLELTSREDAVMRCLAKGLLYKEIPDKLGISFSAVHKLQHRIFIKLHVGNRTEAILKWRGEKLE
jgi:DNA-binding NarL/FixJ family response regulator